MRRETLFSLLVIVFCTQGLAHGRPKAKKREPCIGVPLYTPHEILMVMRANLWRLCICYEEADHWPQRKAAAPKARFNIARSGATTKVRVEGTKNALLKKCLTGAVRKTRFPPWRYSAMVEMVVKSYPLFVHRSSPDGKVPPKRVEYREGALAVTEAKGVVTVTLPTKAREALASLSGFRLPTARDLEPKARIASGFPYPFAVVVDLDRKPGFDLAIALVNKADPGRWRLVALHSQRAARGYTLVTVASFDKIRGRFPKLAAFSVTNKARCFCKRLCIAVASNAGKALEYEWDGKRYVETVEHYLPRKSQ